MAYLLPRPIQGRYRSLAVHLFLILSLSLSPALIQASSTAPYQGVKEMAQGDGQARPLEAGRPIERELSGGRSHSYEITMAAGQYLQLVVDQRGIDVVVAFFAPDGEKRSEVDSPNGSAGPETVSAIAEAAGTYKIEVRSLEKAAEAGRYEVKIEELRVATAEDKYRVEAWAVFQQAKQLGDGPLEAKRRSIERYREALELFRKAGARKLEVETLNETARVYYILGERQQALEKYDEALSVSRAVGDREWEAKTLTGIGALYEKLGEMRKSLENHNQALLIAQAAGDRKGEVTILVNIGNVHLLSGESQNALEKFNQALPISRIVGDREVEANTLNSLGGVYLSVGELQKALDRFNEALPIIRGVGNTYGEAVTLSNIGVTYWSLGEFQKALDKHNEALLIKRAMGDRGSEAVTLNNIGAVYWSLGEMQKALEKYNEVLLLSRAVGNRRAEAATLNNISKVYNSLGETQKALEKLNEALPIGRAIGERITEASTLLNMGMAYRLSGETQKALEKYNEALLTFRAIGQRLGEAATLLGIVRVEQKRGNLIQARQLIEQAIDIIESQRAGLGSQELRATYLASSQEFYQSHIDILMQMHQQDPTATLDAAALTVSERARARSLLELLTEARIDIRQGVDSSLLKRERSLQQRLTAQAAAQVKLLNRKHTPAQAEAIAKEIASIIAEYEEVAAQIRTSSPKYAALTQPQPLNLSEIQQQVLDPDTLLLEYSLGENASYLFVVSQTSITTHQLPKRGEIEAATRRVRELLTAPHPKPGDSSAAFQARIKKARADYWPQAAALSQMLLGPAASQLGNKRLLIVADGVLQYLSFGALPVPERLSEGARGRLDDDTLFRPVPVPSTGREPAPSSRPPIAPTPLIVEHEIVHLPSASTLAVLRRELAGRQPAPKAVAVLADPVFSADDARVKLAASARNGRISKEEPKERPADLTRALTDVRGELSRLLMTRDEAQTILSLTPANSQLEALDFRASRATSTSDELSQYRIVHFATHGLLNSEHPKLSGLVLSLVDERGEPQDGFLQLHEVFNLRLPAELVVLSACQTGLGKELKGEGLVGLTRGFMYAGAARVMASLWKVDDTATAELMKRFYRGMLKEGKKPAAALRAAQIEMWKRPPWQSPYYWGAFVLQGEWK
jgi:tetratricopeptide (TPR) repeat protein